MTDNEIMTIMNTMKAYHDALHFVTDLVTKCDKGTFSIDDIRTMIRNQCNVNEMLAKSTKILLKQ